MNTRIIKILFRNLKKSYLKACLVILILGLGPLSCTCNPKIKPEQALIMKITPLTGLLGDQQKIQVSLELARDVTMVSLEKYQLKIFLATQGTGKAELIYEKDAKAQLTVVPDKPLKQELSYFGVDSELTTENAPFEISFDLKTLPGVTEATIKFELLDETGKLVKDGTSVWHSSDKPVDLKLERIGNEVLQGGKKEFEVKITNRGTEETKANQLKLRIIRDKGNTATIDDAVEQKGGTYSLNFPDKVGAGRGYFTKKMVVNLGTDVEAVFKLKLIYNEEEQKDEVTVTCKQGTIDIQDLPKRFVGDHVVEFGLFNNSGDDMQASDFSLELVSDNTATFEFIAEGKPIKLEKILINPILKKEKSFGKLKFKINNPNGQAKVGVIVKLKKGTQEVAVSEKIVWEADGVDVKLESEEPITGFKAFKVRNIGKSSVNTDDIRVIFTNPQGINFKLGNVSGTNIDTSLTKILGTNSVIQAGQFVSFEIQPVDDPKNINKYGADLSLKLQDKDGDSLDEKKEEWINGVKIADFDAKINNVASNHNQIENEFERLNSVDEKEDNEEWIERTTNMFKLRSRADASVSEFKNVKILYKKLLDQEEPNLPAFLKVTCNYRINLADNYLVQQIDSKILEKFELVRKRALGALEHAKQLAENNQAEAQKSIEIVRNWDKVADRFATEIGTTEAKELAKEVDGYKNTAEGLLPE